MPLSKKDKLKIIKRTLKRYGKNDDLDCLKGPMKAFLMEERNILVQYVKFKHASFGMCRDSRETINAWIHEFTELSLNIVLSRILAEMDLNLKLMERSVKRIFYIGNDGKIFNPRVVHILAALCTESQIGYRTVYPDEFASIFLRKKPNTTALSEMNILMYKLCMDLNKVPP